MNEKSEEYKKLIELMKAARKKSGVKQAEVAEKMNVAGAKISNWEKGNSGFSLDEFVKYCKIVGTDYAELLKSAYGDPTAPSETIKCTQREIDMINKFRFLDPRAQKVIIRNLNAEYEDSQRNLVEDSLIAGGTG